PNHTSGGGGVANIGGSITVLNSSISDNSGPYGGRGGGVANFGGSLTVLNSTISRNSLGYEYDYSAGGGVANLGSASLTVLNSTISGNRETFFCDPYVVGGFGCFGGNVGALLNDPDGTVTLVNTTITGNFSLFEGGVRNGGKLALAHTLIAGNSGSSEVSNNGGAVVAHNPTLLGETGNAGVSVFTPGPTDIAPPAGGQLANILDPTLADNGGPTQTHAPAPGSPAIDGGSTDCTDA